MATSGSEYAQQIADIQHKQKTKRHASLSSENFSSSRSVYLSRFLLVIVFLFNNPTCHYFILILNQL